IDAAVGPLGNAVRRLVPRLARQAMKVPRALIDERRFQVSVEYAQNSIINFERVDPFLCAILRKPQQSEAFLFIELRQELGPRGSEGRTVAPWVDSQPDL